MANAPLKRGEALIWLPSRRDGERGIGASEACFWALRNAEGGLAPRVDRVSLDGLQGTRQVRLLLDPRDVTLLTPQLPPLSGARLLQAIPNAIEDGLLQEVAACAVVPGPALADGRRLVAVVDRAWLETVVRLFEDRGMRVRAVWPAQLAVPLGTARWSMVCVHDAIALRTSPHSGLGWTAGEDSKTRMQAFVALLDAALVTAERPAGITVLIDDAAWSEPLRAATQVLGLTADIAPLHPLQHAACEIDLLAGRASQGRRLWAAFDPRAWRLPAGLAAACVLVGLVGLNLHWLQLAREQTALRRAMETTFRSTFPQAQVVVDPLLQMTRQVAELRARTGQMGADDFVPVLVRFAGALGSRGNDALAAVEYRDGRLRVRFQPQQVERRAAREALQQDCERVGLSLQFDNERDAAASVVPRI